MLSQGFSTTHVESTIGSSENSRKHCSDSHNMLTLRGHKVPPKAKETLHARTGRELKPEHYDTSAGADVDQQTSDATPLAEGTGASSAPPIVEGSGAIATSDAQQSTGADVDQQTSDATPLAEEWHLQPLLDKLIFETESDAQSEAADSMLQQLHGFPALLEIRTVSYTHLTLPTKA